MDLRLLRYFVAIVDCGSISQASRDLGVAQPALSHQISQLEGELGVPLLHRIARGITPTEGGKRLYGSARDILSRSAALPDLVRGAVLSPVGEVRFAMSGTVSELVGVALLQAAKARYPGIQVRLVEAMSGHILEWLRRGDVDVALVYATSDPKGLSGEHVLTENLCLFGIPGGPVAKSDDGSLSLAATARLNLILPGPTHGLRKLVDEALAPARRKLHPVFEVDSYNSIKRLARAGCGYGILPETAISSEVRDGTFQSWRIGSPPLRRKIFLTYPSDRPLSSAAAAVSEICLDATRKLVRDGSWIADIPSASTISADTRAGWLCT